MNRIESKLNHSFNESLNTIEYKLNFYFNETSSDDEEAMLHFFNDIKEEVYEKAKSSQKKYINFKDNCTTLKRDTNYSFEFSYTNAYQYNYEKHEIKNFNEEYERFTKFFIDKILNNQGGKYVVIDFKIEFSFTDFSLREHCTPLTHSLPSKEEIEMESPKKEKSLNIVFLPKSIKESKRIMRSYGVRYPPSLSHRKTRCAPGGLDAYMKHI